MSPTAAPSSTKTPRAEFSIPGKVFLLGEYAVLAGGSAILAAVGPRFHLRTGEIGDTAASTFHPQSPAGRLLGVARRLRTRGFEFVDPHLGQGGFGASTAQFALLYGAFAEEAGWDLSAQAVRRVYRELLMDESVPPSGADLIAQLCGGVIQFNVARESIQQLSECVDWGQLLIFSAVSQSGRKVPTHEHLAGLGSLRANFVTDLSVLVERAEQALVRGDSAAFGMTLTEYAEALSSEGLELEASRADRLALSSLSGVLGAKGTGALLADAMIVWLKPEIAKGSEARVRVLQAAQARGLKLVADGLAPEAGWLCEPT